MPDSVVHTIRTVKAHHQTFVVERLNSNIVAFNVTVHKNNLPLLHLSQDRNRQSPLPKYATCKMMCISSPGCTYRVKPETVIWMPSSNTKIIIGLRRWRQMHQTSKSDLMECLDSVVPDVDVKIVDCAALVRIMDPKKSQVSVKTFLTMQSSCSCHIYNVCCKTWFK